MKSNWIELIGNSFGNAAFDVTAITSVRQDGKGCIIVCGGIEFKIPKIPYEDGLKMAQFLRSKDSRVYKAAED